MDLTTKRSLLAGSLIGLSLGSYLLADNKYMGTFLFGLGLFAICALSLNLFTGKCGYDIKIKNLFSLWFLNAIGFIVTIIIVILATNFKILPTLQNWADIKINRDIVPIFCSSLLCGMLIAYAVEITKKHGIGIGAYACLLVVFTFILNGFDHCIANLGVLVLYPLSQGAWLLCLISTIGNVIGAKALIYFLY